ncbi:MAG: squalene--hopene cyclase, partial [Planctomycetia bacterium]|nr:squalene--hopene cyclase [Planctomycetia bacterium]
INKGISYYQKMTSTSSGFVAYAGGMGGFGDSLARSSIATLVYAVARRKDLPEYKATLGHIKDRLEEQSRGYVEYGRYYQAQALFQGDVPAWEKWNRLLTRQLKQAQQPDGSFPGQYGPGFGTSMSLLALALNYRFLPIYER